jgi:hypothetical protein
LSVPGPRHILPLILNRAPTVLPRIGPTTMLRARRARRLLLGTVLAALAGCGQGDDLAEPAPPALRVTTVTAGNGSDPDGYALVIDGRAAILMQPLDTVLESGVSPGAHTIDLQGISEGCSVQGGPSRTAQAAEGTTTVVDFVVTCSVAEPAPTGSIRVTLTTSGVDLDPDGYVVSVDPAENRPVGISEEIRIEGIVAGLRDLRLSGVAANCGVQGENPREVEVPAAAEAEVAFAVRCWPPASGRIAFIHSSAFLEARQLVIIGADGNELADFNTTEASTPSWSPPDGRFVAIVDFTVSVGEVSTGATVPLPECQPTSAHPAWSPDGQRLLCLDFSSTLFSIRRDGTLRVELSPSDLPVAGASFLANGDVLFVVESPDHTLYRVRPQGGTPVRIFGLPSGALYPAAVVPSPDGLRTTYMRDRADNRTELYAVDLDGGEPHLLSADLSASGTPAWSPDGEHIAFIAGGDDGTRHLWVVHRDGSGLTELRLPGPPDESLSWSPDGSRLVMAIGQDGPSGEPESSIYIIRADASGLERLTSSGYDQEPVWGP